MENIPHIVSSLNAPWCGWTMLGLLLCAIVSEWIQPGVISQATTSLIVRNDRTYKESPANFMGQVLITLFRIGTIAMALCLCMAQEGKYSFVAFMAISGIIFAVFALKMLFNGLIDYTFTLTRRFGAPYEHYGNLLTLMTLALYPILLLLIHFVSPLAAQWCLGGLTFLFCLLWFYRCFRTYSISAVAVLYLILYITTLELLPLAGLAYLSAKTIAIL